MTIQRITGVASVLCSVVLLLSFASASGNPKAAAQPARGAGRPDLDRRCVAVGGTVMTNFGAIDASTTMGTATGDLRGAVSGTLLGAPQPGAGGTLIFHVQHHWVTETGDTLFFDPATATTAPLGSGLFAIVTYPVHLKGGTGRFAGATGDVTNIGEVSLPNAPDIAGGTTIFRYTGQVCFADRD